MAEATGLRNNALNYPIYGAPFGIVFPILDADGDLVTAAAGLDSEVSKNGDTAADCTNEATEIATSSGMYYLLLTGTELTADVVTGITKTSTSGAKTTSWSLYPRKLVTVRSGTAAGGDTGYITLDANAVAVDDYYNGLVCIATIDSAVEVRVITDYTGSNKQAAVTPDWNVAPDNDDTFVIKLPEGAQIPTVDVTLWKGATAPAMTGDAYAVVAHADYGNAKLVRSTTPANTLTVDASHQALALTNAVTNDAITAAAIANGAIDAATFAAGAIDAAAIANGAIDAATFAAGAIDAAAIATGAIDADAIADGAIDNGALAADAISAAKIAADVTTELQSGLATSAELAKVPKSDSNVTWNATALASIQAEATDALNAYDPPTNAELEARTLVAANYFDPAADTVANVTTVATTTNLTNLPAAAALEATLTAMKGATFSGLTDSLEALRDRGDAAWITATGFATPTNITAGTITTVTNLTNLPAAAALEATLTDMKGAGYSNTTDTLEKIRDAIPAAAPSAADNATAAAAAILATPANLLVTDASGRVEVSGAKNTLDDLNDAAAAPSAADIKTALEADGSKLDHLWEMTEDDGGVRRLTANALEEAPVDGAAPTVGDIADAVWDEALAGHAGAGTTGAALSAAGAAGDPWITALPGAYAAGSAGDIIGNLVDDIGALTPAVAISATTAASVSTGALAVRTYHSLSQAISSTYAGNLNAATKLWLAVKAEKDDTDAQSVIFIEKTAGLTVLAGAAYTTVAHGSLTVGGLAGAWTVTVALDEVATGLLTAYADGMLWAECKALVAGSTVAVWDGVCDVARGIVVAVA